MKFKPILFLFLIVFLFVSFKSETIHATHNSTSEYVFGKCHNTPIPGGASSPNWTQIHKEVLDPNGIPRSTSKGQINLNYLYKRHIVVYGSPFGEHDKTKKVCGLDIYRWQGYSLEGIQLSDWDFRPDKGGAYTYIKTTQLARYPWNTSGIIAKANAYDWFPKPTKDNLYASDAERIKDLDNAIDTFAPDRNSGHGYFLEKNNYWCESGGTIVLNAGGKCGANGALLTGKYLKDFAVITSRPTNFSPGSFDLFVYDTGCNYYPYCYATFVIPQYKDPFTINHDASVSLTLNKSKYTDEKVTGTIKISNNWSAKLPQSISSPCDKSGNASKAQCKTSNQYGGIIVKARNGGKQIYGSTYSFPDISQGNTYNFSLNNLNIMPDKSGMYDIYVSIPHYKDKNGKEETSYTNNELVGSFEFELTQNAKVRIEGEKKYTIADNIKNKIIVTNETASPLSGNIKIFIKDENGNIVKDLGSKPFTNIPVNKEYTYDISSDNALLKLGKYTLHAVIPNYTSLPEITYDDNKAEYALTIIPFIPENTKCEKISTNYTKILPYNGTNPGITKSCMGWAPNFPSTHIEGGQGTFFYFAYKIFPTPLPAYKVTTNDKLGLSQSFELLEPSTTPGACNLTLASDTTCSLYEPYIYYPSKWEERFNTNEYKDFKGPYMVGAHKYHHYRYRGRMVPKNIDFHFKIVDMKGNSNIPLANGTISYDIPDECYYDHVIDIKDECRLIQFYAPVNNIDYLKYRPLTLPEDAAVIGLPDPDERVTFFNPGEHIFRVEIDENQMYLYQTDEGAEWQGKTGVPRLPYGSEKGAYATGPVKTHKTSGTSPITWISEDTYKNQCYSNEDAFSDTGQWNESTNDFTEIDSPALECFHNHDKDFHYWRYQWTKVKKFGNNGLIY